MEVFFTGKNAKKHGIMFQFETQRHVFHVCFSVKNTTRCFAFENMVMLFLEKHG
jgi:hypothetical protein